VLVKPVAKLLRPTRPDVSPPADTAKNVPPHADRRVPKRDHGPDGKPEPGLPKATVDLLPLVDPKRHTVNGAWTLEDGALVSSGATFERVLIPYAPPDEYVLRVVIEPRDKRESFSIGLVKESQFLMVLDAWVGAGGPLAALELIDGKVSLDNETTRRGDWPTANKPRSSVRSATPASPSASTVAPSSSSPTTAACP
jgi:hypothetical protein